MSQPNFINARRVRHTPLWRRITALFTLGSIVIMGGVFLATLITVIMLMAMFLVERAIA